MTTSAFEQLRRLQANMVAHGAYLPARAPGACVFHEPQMTLIDSGCPSVSLNAVCRIALDAQNAEPQIAQALRHYAEQGFPVSWWLDPLCKPADLGARLHDHGLTASEPELCMWCPLEGPVPLPRPFGDFSVRRATNLFDLADFAAVRASRGEPSDEEALGFYARAAKAALTPNAPCRFFVGYLEEEPVAAGECFHGDGIAGLYFIVVHPAHRRRGYASALTAAALADARAQGLAAAGLEATPAGAGVYRRMGFEAVGELVEYRYWP